MKWNSKTGHIIFSTHQLVCVICCFWIRIDRFSNNFNLTDTGHNVWRGRSWGHRNDDTWYLVLVRRNWALLHQSPGQFFQGSMETYLAKFVMKCWLILLIPFYLFLLVKWLLNGILHIGQFFRFGLALQVSQIICPSLHWNIFFGGHAISRHTGHSRRL